MKLLTEGQLIWSAVVANNRMNRKRKASGVNSYEKDLKFKPEEFLHAAIDTWGGVKWLDLCCGEGNALLQCALELAESNKQEQACLEGIDLVDQFQPIPSNITCLRLQELSIGDWTPTDRYHLVTCVHGLHYIGDKLGVISRVLQAIEPGGLFIANLALENIKIRGDRNGKFLKKLFADHQIDYNVRQNILRCEGPRRLSFSLRYSGADDKAGPNYTGQEVVDSYYE